MRQSRTICHCPKDFRWLHAAHVFKLFRAILFQTIVVSENGGYPPKSSIIYVISMRTLTQPGDLGGLPNYPNFSARLKCQCMSVHQWSLIKNIRRLCPCDQFRAANRLHCYGLGAWGWVKPADPMAELADDIVAEDITWTTIHDDARICLDSKSIPIFW